MSDLIKAPSRPAVPVPITGAKKFVVTIQVFALRDEEKHPGCYVPAADFAGMIRKEILQEAAQTVKDAMQLDCYAADFNQPVLEMRAKVEVKLNVQDATGFSALTKQQAAFLYTLRDDIVELIQDLEPPKRAWVLIGKASEAPKGKSNVRRKSGGSRATRPVKPAKTH
jgi:hypothetical protein